MNPEIMTALGFGKEMELVAKGLCPWCSEKVGEFKDEISRQEYKISGLCQKCQDKVKLFDNEEN